MFDDLKNNDLQNDFCKLEKKKNYLNIHETVPVET